MKKLSDKGMSLIELTMALGLSTIVVLGATHLFKNQSFNHSSNHLDVGEELDVIAKLMTNRGICTDTLKKQTIGSIVPSIRKGDKIFYTNGQKLNRSQISSISIERSSTWTPAPNEYGPVALKLKVIRDNKVITKNYPLGVQLDEMKKVVSCFPNVNLANVEDDIYNQVCNSVVKGSLSNSKCNWTKPTVVIVTYIPAPPPQPVNDFSCIGPICDMYLTILGRYPEAGGKAYWEEQYANLGADAVNQGIKDSKEANGLEWTQEDQDNWDRDVIERGMSLSEGHEVCGVTKTC